MKKEQPMDYAVELSKTSWAAHMRLAAEIDKLGAALAESMPMWFKNLQSWLSLKRGSF